MSRLKIFTITVLFIWIGSSITLFGNVSSYEEIWNTGYSNAKLPEDSVIGPLQDYASDEGLFFGNLTVTFFDHLAKGTLSDDMLLPGSRLILRRNLMPLEKNIYPITNILIGEVMKVRSRCTVPFRLILENGNTQEGEIFFEEIDGSWYVSGLSSLQQLILPEEGNL